MRQWAGNGKLTPEQLISVKQGGHLDTFAAAWNVCVRTLQRIRAGDAWRNGWQPQRIPDTETKDCAICGRAFGRRWKNGRRRSDAFWAQKRTCSNGCNVKLQWREGKYENRGK